MVVNSIMMDANYFLQAEVAIASKLLSGKCGVDMLKVTFFILLSMSCFWHMTKMYVNLF